MKIFKEPQRTAWAELCRRPHSDDPQVTQRVKDILTKVQEGGDDALRALALEIDGYSPASFELSAEEIEEAKAQVPDNLKDAIQNAASNIRKFHQAEIPSEIEVTTTPGVRCIQRPVPINKVGLYIPGGTAPLFSTVLMLAIPASLAGCKEIVLCSPAGKDGRIAPAVVYSAALCGVKKIFRLGGAQAIAAMAYGTQTVPAVDKIFGPGNRYVTTAKQLVGLSKVAVDMPAGPSEVMVIADGSARADFVAADLLSQAEHGKDSQVILLTDDEEIAGKVQKEINIQVRNLGREQFAQSSLENSRCVILSNIDDIVDFAECYAPEHLIIETENPWSIADRITASGSVFVGHYSPESAGDYASGTNHTLPTCGWARSFSGVNMDAFIRKMTIQELSRDGIRNLSDTIITMAEAEGLQAHANAAKIRKDE